MLEDNRAEYKYRIEKYVRNSKTNDQNTALAMESTNINRNTEYKSLK